MFLRRISLSFLALVVIVFALAAFGSACTPRSSGSGSDAEMTRYFQDHKAQFVELLGLLQQDPRIVDIGRVYTDNGDGAITIRDISGQSVSGVRAQQVLALWAKLDLKYFYGYEGAFRMESMSEPDDGPFKAFDYATSPPARLVQTETESASNGSEDVCRAIGDGWYILYAQRG